MICRNNNLIHLSETESTNSYLQLLARLEDLADETVVLTDFQTAGRGQSGNSWESENGKNLTFSILFYPKQLPANQPFVIAELAALFIKRILDEIVSGITVKWPNDIYWQDRKICGILVENMLAGGLIRKSIIGAGINLNQEIFHGNAVNPVSLKQITGKTYNRLELLEKLRISFHKIRNQLETQGIGFIHHTYTNSLYRLKGLHSFSDKNGNFKARIHHIELSGHLVLKRENGNLSKYAFKEVTCIN
ncbi:MAG: biotin--[acetyl-CoA-carboxylase] ligase [Tannerella sp.]|jgi:BirA family biotin operon repressor/biotin-[acetyl-CoA-carboxylase] ligase|nr:biotin--[acetyl-CoA-carboxylase] ligase [Tannerella sp.]